MDKQTKEAKEMTKSLPFDEKIKNFWYYKKWWVIAAAALVVVAAITIYEISMTPQYDLFVGYYSEKPISDQSLDKLKDLMTGFATDTNGDGKITISITPMEASRETENDELVAVQTRLMSELTSGENMLYVCDQAYRDYLMSGDNQECFSDEFNMNDNPELKQQIGYIDDTLYILLKDLYQREEGSSKKRMAHNNAVNIFEGIKNLK